MARRKNQEHEKLDDANMTKVIELLGSDTPITKKAACGILNIAYNTKRLGTLIEEYQERVIFSKRKRAEMRTRAVSREDAKYIITEYLEGTAVQEISERTFRGTSVIKKVLDKYKVPIREVGSSYFDPIYLPDDGHKTEYAVGDLVFSARYNVPARIKSLKQKHKDHGNVYAIYLLGTAKQNAYQPAYELGDLTYLEGTLGIKLSEE